MKRPTWDEVKLLFEYDKTGQQDFINRHQNELEDLLDDLSNDGEDALDCFDIAFSWPYGIVVDWREYEENIVTYFSETLDDEESLSCKYDQENSSLFITYNDEVHTVQLTESLSDRYIVIKALRNILKEKYSFKLFAVSYMSDTHVFLLLPAQWWEKVESDYPEKGKELFMDISDQLDFP